MQQAARQVHAENALLHNLLREAGISDLVVQQRLSGSRSNTMGSSSTAMVNVPTAPVTVPPVGTSTSASYLTPGSSTASGTLTPDIQAHPLPSDQTIPLQNYEAMRLPASFNTAPPWPAVASSQPGPMFTGDLAATGTTNQYALSDWDLDAWLADLSNIKNAFGAEITVGKAISLDHSPRGLKLSAGRHRA